jgi:hypothetical protein
VPAKFQDSSCTGQQNKCITSSSRISRDHLYVDYFHKVHVILRHDLQRVWPNAQTSTNYTWHNGATEAVSVVTVLLTTALQTDSSVTWPYGNLISVTWL